MKISKVLGQRILRDAVKQELAVLQTMEHPYIVHIFELLFDDQNLYFVAELMEHKDLMHVHEEIIRNNWSFTEQDVKNMIKQILLALNYMHKQNYLHRDLKLENVMVDVQKKEDGSNEIVCKLTDFGFAMILEQNQKTKQKLGTPRYMAPELVSGKRYDSKVDLWALGVLAYILLSDGKFPFEGRSIMALNNSIRTARPNYDFLQKYSDPQML